MNKNVDITLKQALLAIEEYPYLRACFSDYLIWLFDECDENRRKYDAVYLKIASSISCLHELENIFYKFGSILEMNEADFCKAFRFDVDRNKLEILKIGDLLAEPWSAFALHNSGFASIKKASSKKSKMCDFTANYGSTKFAIEIKNLRSGDFENYYRWLTYTSYNKQNVFLSSYFKNSQGQLHKREEESLQYRMNNLLKDEENRQKISEQLENAKKKYSCQATMLIGFLDLIMVLGEFPEMVIDNLEDIRNQFPVSDYLACCFHKTLFCSPQLS